MKKFLLALAIPVCLTITASAQDSMNKKIDNTTDKMVKKIDNTNDKMVKKIENKPKEADRKIDTLRRKKAIPKARKPEDN